MEQTIGKLGFGFMRMPMAGGLGIDMELLKQMVDTYLAAGFKYFDTAYVYTGSEEALREALVRRHPRDNYMVTTKMPVFLVKTQDDMQKAFDTSLERLGLDHLDFYLLHGLSLETGEKLEQIGGWDFVRNLKEQGRIRNYGFSYHDSPEHLDILLSRHPDVDIVQLQINYLDWEDPEVQSRRLYETARKHNKPFNIMGPVKGGLLSGAGSEAETMLRKINPDVSAASWAVRFVAPLEGLHVMLSGMGTMEQLEDNINTIKNLKPLSDEEKAVLREVADVLHKMPTIPCTGCKYCVENCPQKLKIPALIELYNEFITFNQKRSIGYTFEEVTAGGLLPSKCTACHSCEKHCPQHIEIPDTMRKAADAYEQRI
ncbi:MAG: aldo/keto reductase [Oscillospiraceae bacterium]|nr:aldo/keto reductase [Oscillospiraceae bacterium]